MIRFLPDEYYSSTYKIDFKKYYDMGYRGILFQGLPSLKQQGTKSCHI